MNPSLDQQADAAVAEGAIAEELPVLKSEPGVEYGGAAKQEAKPAAPTIGAEVQLGGSAAAMEAQRTKK